MGRMKYLDLRVEMINYFLSPFLGYRVGTDTDVIGWSGYRFFAYFPIPFPLSR